MSHPIEKLKQIMGQLRDPEHGCPWDKKQTFESVIPCTIEETYEVVDAIHKQDWDNLKEELGDYVFQAIFYSQLAQEQGLFDFDDVIQTVNEKLIRRHPHVFTDDSPKDEDEIRANWDKIKQQEKLQQGVQPQSIFDSVPVSLPALSKANKIQKRCAKYGFDWDTLAPVIDKVKEEIDEVMDEAYQEDIDQSRIEEELGDLLFATVNLVRHFNCDPDVVLNKANGKFMHRFQQIEAIAREEKRQLNSYTLEQLDDLWDQVKLAEKQVKN